MTDSPPHPPDLSHAPPALWRRAWPIAALVVATAIYHAPLIFSPADQRIDCCDISNYLLWVHQFSRGHLLAGQLPLWNPHVYAGVPFLANPQTTVFYPPSWLLLAMPVHQAHKWLIVGHVLATGCFMLLLVRRLGPGRLAATLAALAWMFGSYFTARPGVGHLTLMMTAAWMPLALYCYDRAIVDGSRRWLVLTGGVMGLQLLAGGDQNCYYTVLLLAVFGLVRVISDRPAGLPLWRPRRWVGWFAGLALVGATAAALSAAQLLPTAEMATQSDRWGNGYEFATAFSASPGSGLGLLLPWRADLPILRSAGGATFDLNWEFAGYVGILTLMLAAASLGVRRSTPLRAAWAVAVLAVVIALGHHTAFYRVLYYALPGLKLFRVPGRAVVLLALALCICAAFGFEHLLADARWRRWRWRAPLAAAPAVVAGGLAVVVAAGLYRPAALYAPCDIAVTLRTGPVATAVAVLLATAAIVLGVGAVGRRRAMLLLAALLAIDLLAARQPLAMTAAGGDDPRVARMQADADLLADTQPFRIDLAQQHIDADVAMAAEVENVNGYWPVALGRFYRYVHTARGVPAHPALRHDLRQELYATGRPFPLPLLNVRGETRIEPTGKITLHRDDHALPRAWLADRVELIAGDEAALARTTQPDFDPRRAVILAADPGPRFHSTTPAPTTAAAEPAVTLVGDWELLIDAQSDRPTHLVVSQIFYPGWRASVDGQPVELKRADYLISAVELPPGRHTVRLWYDPASVKAGLAVSLAGLLLVSVAGVSLAVGRCRGRRGGGAACGVGASR